MKRVSQMFAKEALDKFADKLGEVVGKIITWTVICIATIFSFYLAIALFIWLIVIFFK